ncbi:hypothetical protein PFISCL1PPCAC_235, partial [Pristionchus fissidentatus]
RLSKQKMEIIDYLLEDMTVENVNVELPPTFDCEEFLHFIAAMKVRKIRITVGHLSNPDPAQFLLRLAD